MPSARQLIVATGTTRDLTLRRNIKPTIDFRTKGVTNIHTDVSDVQLFSQSYSFIGVCAFTNIDVIGNRNAINWPKDKIRVR